MKKRKAIYPGSFDPVTFGHLDLVGRALELFDELIVVVADNPSKKTTFTAFERVKFLKEAIKHPRVKVMCWEGLTVDFAKKMGASTIIRGIRATSDFDYEFQMAFTNRQLNSKADTVFLMPSARYTYLSSTMIRQIAQLGGDVKEFLPDCVREKLVEKFKKK